MLKTGFIFICLVCMVTTPLVNAESIGINQNISETAGLSFAIKNCTYNFTVEKDENLGLDQVSNDENAVRIPGAVKKYELVTLNQPQINTNLRSTSHKLSIQIDGVDYLTDLKRMDFESIEDGIDSYSGPGCSE